MADYWGDGWSGNILGIRQKWGFIVSTFGDNFKSGFTTIIVTMITINYTLEHKLFLFEKGNFTN
jgi:hypothetical protein